MDWIDWTTVWRDLEYLARVAVAVLLAIPLGWDRERRSRPAGLRTHLLVAAASATFMVLGDAIVASFREEAGMVQMDPLRTLEAVVTGVGFLAAGTIFRSDGGVKGLTTAGSIWATAAVALCVGSGRYMLGVGVTLLALVVLVVLRKLTGGDEDAAHFDNGAPQDKTDPDASPSPSP